MHHATVVGPSSEVPSASAQPTGVWGTGAGVAATSEARTEMTNLIYDVIIPTLHGAPPALRTALTQQRQQLVEQLQQHTLLGSREFSFCLFKETLIDQLKQMAQPADG